MYICIPNFIFVLAFFVSKSNYYSRAMGRVEWLGRRVESCTSSMANVMLTFTLGDARYN